VKRTPLRPSLTEMKRGGPIARKTKIRPKRPGPPRRGSDVHEAARAFIRSCRCVVEVHSPVPDGCRYRNRQSDCAHRRVRHHGDTRNMLPLCHRHHRMQHGLNMSLGAFAERYRLPLELLCEAYWTVGESRDWEPMEEVT